MVAEWEAAVTKFTELTPHLHYGTCSWRRASYRAALHGIPWGIVVILTIDTFYQWFNQEEANGSKCLGHGIFLRVIMDEAHRLRTSVTPIGKFRKANGTMVKIVSRDYNMHMASYIISLEPRYRWMLMATPLVNGIEHLRWILRFRESSSWLTLQLPPDTFGYTHNFDDHWVTDGSNVSGTERGAVFMPVAATY
jgi:hypothetical protein